MSKKEKRYKSTRELVGEVVSWLLIIVGTSFLFQGSFGIIHLNKNDTWATIARNSLWIFGSMIIISGIIYGLTNAWANKSNKKFQSKLHRLLGNLVILFVFGFGVFEFSADIFSPNYELHKLWLWVNNILIIGILIFGINQTINVGKSMNNNSKKEEPANIDDSSNKKEKKIEEKMKEDEIIEILKNYKIEDFSNEESEELELW